jgi:predicted Zn-dependent protease
MCHCHAHHRASRPPTLGRRRFTALLLGGASLPALAACDPAGVGELFVSADDIERLGLETWERIREEEPRSTNQANREKARAMTARILSAVGEDPDAWEVEVFAGDQANAWVLPGKRMGIYDGMFALAEDDDQLAAVIGHEIGHDQAGHARQRVAREIGTQATLQLVSTALQLGDIAYANQIAGLFGAGAQYGIILPYSREQELEADEIGLTNMARAGYDPEGAIRLWQNMAEQPTPPTFASTHPAPEGRIRALEAMLPEARAIYEAAS